ncbi:MAG: hypothetical protein ACOX1Q_00135 [Eubacteriales bacterium]
MKSTTLKKVLSILVVAVMIIALAACNSDNGVETSPEVSETPTESPEVSETPEPTPTLTPTPTPTPEEGNYFDRDISLTADPESSFPGSTIFLGADGTFDLNVPGIGNDKGTYSIDGEKLKVVGSEHEYSFREEDGEIIVTLSAAGGAITVDFLQD